MNLTIFFFRTKKIITGMVIFSALLLVCACRDVPDEILQQPRAVSAPSLAPETTDWPRLGDVPAKPKDFSPKPVINQSRQELIDDRTEAETIRRTTEIPPTTQE